MVPTDGVPSDTLSGIAKEISRYYFKELSTRLELEEWQERLSGGNEDFTKIVTEMLIHWGETKDNATIESLRKILIRIGLQRLAEKYLSVGDQ